MKFIERAKRCVVFIGGEDESGQFCPYGTGFLITIFHEEIQFDYIVTCFHVIDIATDRVFVRVNIINGNSKIIETPKSMWITDSKNDIAVLSHHFSIDTYAVARINQRDFLTSKFIQTAGIYAGENTFLVGLFTSHHGDIHNMPIVRVGIIAAIPEEPILTDTGYVNAYLVESRSIGGLSGSPVFIYRFCGVYALYPPTEGILSANFLGMLRGRLNTTDRHDVVGGDSITDTINTGIGVVVPVEEIMNVINQPILVSQREKTVEQLKKKSHYRPTAAIPDTENPQHKEDFNSLVSAAAKKKPQDD